MRYVIHPEVAYAFFLQNHIDSLQEAFIHSPEPCEARFIMEGWMRFDYFWTVEKKKHPPILPF